MNTVSHLLHGKGHEVWSIGPDASVYDAIHLMAEKGNGALVDWQGELLVSIIAERDYAREGVRKDRAYKETMDREINRGQVGCEKPNETSGESPAGM